MSILLGEYALAGAMLTAMAVVFAAIAYVRVGNDGLLRFARIGQVLLAAMLGVSSWGLLKALLDDNFNLAYVVKHSEKALPTFYKAAAFWAGQEGSLLFWALLLGLMGVIMAWRSRKADTRETAVSLAVMATVTGFFTAVMLFAGNPFDPATEHTHNGMGLNPMLQNLAMVFHPPMLFLGYAGYTAPFALLLGALLTGRKDAGWLRDARAWMVYSWVTLTVGIVLGSWWAYMELGWGGYWAWDPVENASLLPWLTGTALLHSAVLMARRGIFKRWTAVLTAASFFLCVLGTYLTRSGVIQSMHSFGESPIGTFFLVFLVLTGLVSVGVLLFRLDLLKAEHALDDLFTREGFFLMGNVLLSLMTLITLGGTISPVISGWFSTTPVTVGPPFYNKVILPLGLLLAALMATGPVLGSGVGAGARAMKKLLVMAAAGFAAMVIVPLYSHGISISQLIHVDVLFQELVAGGYLSPWALTSAFVIAAVVAGVAIDVLQSIASRPANVSAPRALVRTFTLRPRHWGAQLAHLGMAATVAGVVGSSAYSDHGNLELKPATATTPAVTGRIGHFTLAAKTFEQVRRENHTAIVATISVTPDKGQPFELQPERRFYDKAMDRDQSSSEVSLRASLASDVYLTLAGWEDNGSVVTVGAILNPLVSWIWIGGVLLTLGGLVCLLPTEKAPQVPAPRIPVETVPEPVLEGKTARERRRARTLQPAAAAARN
jgi:cytochrome c-type biogenesis protein CcmF